MTLLDDIRSHNLVHHALRDDCTDPDCELHNLDVAIEEEVIGPAEVAYYIAGAMAMRDLMYAAAEAAQPEGELDVEEYVAVVLDQARDSAHAELLDANNLNGIL